MSGSDRRSPGADSRSRGSGRPPLPERIYALLLRAYPPAFRAEYGREMTLLFRDQCREGDAATFAFWCTVVWDVARSAPAIRREESRTQRPERTDSMEMTMKLAATMTVVFGAIVALNAVAEGIAASHGTLEGVHVIAVVLGGLAGVPLLAAGIALFRGGQASRHFAELAAVASLVLIIIARFMHPWMSIFAQLVGFGLPIALLVTLHWPRGGSRPTSSAA
jgi:hypothetical protein